MKRNAFTLLELMIVILIIATLAAIAILFFPKRQIMLAEDGASQIQTWITSAKSRAMRDQNPTGVRFISNDGGSTYTTATLIATPEAVAPQDPNPSNPALWATYLSMTTQNNVVTQVGFNLQTAGVQVGDMLEIISPSSIHLITAIDYPTGQVSLKTVPLINGTNDVKIAQNYRYILQPQSLLGEQSYQLPNTVVILGNGGPPGSQKLLFSNGHADILFSPSGQVIASPPGRIILWITDTNNVSKPTLLCIYTTTGGCAAHPVGPVGQEYIYTQDGRGSGQ